MDYMLETALAMMPIQWFVMAVLTVAPIALAVPRVWMLAYLVGYALSGAYVVYCARPGKKNPKLMAAKADGMFARIRLQDP